MNWLRRFTWGCAVTVVSALTFLVAAGCIALGVELLHLS